MFLTTDIAVPGEVDTLETSVRRDFIGTADDWSELVKSAIANQLAPPDSKPEER